MSGVIERMVSTDRNVRRAASKELFEEGKQRATGLSLQGRHDEAEEVYRVYNSLIVLTSLVEHLAEHRDDWMFGGDCIVAMIAHSCADAAATIGHISGTLHMDGPVDGSLDDMDPKDIADMVDRAFRRGPDDA